MADKTNYVKMARASAEELDALLKFEEELEELLDQGADSQDIGEWFAAYLKENGLPRGLFASRSLPFSISRIVWGYRTMFDNACDPDAGTLEWKPEIRQLLEAQSSQQQTELEIIQAFYDRVCQRADRSLEQRPLPFRPGTVG